MDRVMNFPPDLIYMFSFGLGLPDQLFGLVIKTQYTPKLILHAFLGHELLDLLFVFIG